MASEDYATNSRVDGLVGELRKDLLATERLLRDRDDEKEKGLRAEFVAAVQASEDRTHSRFDGIEAHLDKQDEILLAKSEVWPAFWRSLVLFAAASIIAALTLHFGFHVG